MIKTLRQIGKQDCRAEGRSGRYTDHRYLR